MYFGRDARRKIRRVELRDRTDAAAASQYPGPCIAGIQADSGDKSDPSNNNPT